MMLRPDWSPSIPIGNYVKPIQSIKRYAGVGLFIDSFTRFTAKPPKTTVLTLPVVDYLHCRC